MVKQPSHPPPDGRRHEDLPLERLLVEVPPPTARFRRRAWLEFQRAIDPLAPPRPPPPRRH